MKKVIYFFNYWSSSYGNYQVSDIPEDVCDIQYNFWTIDRNFNVVPTDSFTDIDKRFVKDGILPFDTYSSRDEYFGNFGQFRKCISNGRVMNVSLVINASNNLSNGIMQDTTLLISNINKTLVKYSFLKGVTFHYPKSDLSLFLLFIKKLRAVLKATYKMSLIIDHETTADHLIKNFIPWVDNFFLMTLNFPAACSDNKSVVTFHTNPKKSKYNNGFSCDEIAELYLSFGIPSHKIYISGAFYGRGFSNTLGPGEIGDVGSSDTGLTQRGIIDYKLLPLQGSTEYNDSESKAAYSYDRVKKVVNTYDNVSSILEKCKIVFARNLGGIVISDISGDKSKDDPSSLIRVLKNNLIDFSNKLTLQDKIKINLEINKDTGEITV
jgi:GH18 family chitinase